MPFQFGTMNVEFIGEGTSDVVVANSLNAYGYPAYNDGFLSDCNLAQIFPTVGVISLKNLPSPCDSDCNSDNKVNLADLVIVKEDFLREDCHSNQCRADFNDDSKVDLEDLSVLKYEFLRTCPFCPDA